MTRLKDVVLARMRPPIIYPVIRGLRIEQLHGCLVWRLGRQQGARTRRLDVSELILIQHFRWSLLAEMLVQPLGALSSTHGGSSVIFITWRLAFVFGELLLVFFSLILSINILTNYRTAKSAWVHISILYYANRASVLFIQLVWQQFALISLYLEVV